MEREKKGHMKNSRSKIGKAKIKEYWNNRGYPHEEAKKHARKRWNRHVLRHYISMERQAARSWFSISLHRSHIQP